MIIFYQVIKRFEDLIDMPDNNVDIMFETSWKNYNLCYIILQTPSRDNVRSKRYSCSVTQNLRIFHMWSVRLRMILLLWS